MPDRARTDRAQGASRTIRRCATGPPTCSEASPTPAPRPVIERLARDPNEDVRANAAEALASFPGDELLSALLADESWVVRSHAAKAAGASCRTNLAARLSELLEDQSWWVRQNAMIALASFGAAAIPPLLAQLHSSDRFARNKAAEALVRNGYAMEQIERVKEGGPGIEERPALPDRPRTRRGSEHDRDGRARLGTRDAEADDRRAAGDRHRAGAGRASSSSNGTAMSTAVEIIFVALLGYFLVLNSLYLAIGVVALFQLHRERGPRVHRPGAGGHLGGDAAGQRR